MTPQWREWLILAAFALCLATGAYIALEHNTHHPTSQEER